MGGKMNRLIMLVAALMCMSSGAAANCYKTTIQEPQPFLGNGGEIIILADGSAWKNVSFLYLYLYAYSPSVVICPGQGKLGLGDHVFDVVAVR